MAASRRRRSVQGEWEHTMEITELGSTGLKVSVAGLGCGGNSKLGLGTGKTTKESVAIVREALDLGVTLLDTAASYGTEAIVGKAIEGPTRDGIILCTKASPRSGRKLLPAESVVASLETSLRTLGTDFIDVFQIHGVAPWAYDHAIGVLLPALLREREKGKIRHIGITETSPRDPSQEMLSRAVRDSAWDTVMLAFNMMHQNARKSILPAAIERGIGTFVMFAVRNIFSRPGMLQAQIGALTDAGELPAWLAGQDEPLGFLVHPEGATSLTDAAYRFARHEPGVDVVLFGTGSQEHLRANVASICKPALPATDRDRLAELFGHLVGVGLDLPGNAPMTAHRGGTGIG